MNNLQSTFEALLRERHKGQAEYVQLVKAAKSLKYFEQMREILIKGVKDYPDNKFLRLELAQSYGNIMRHTQSSFHDGISSPQLKKPVKIDQRTKFKDLAAEQYDYLIKHNLADNIVYCSYAKMLSNFGDFTTAEKYFKKSLELRSDDTVTRSAYKDMYCAIARKLLDAQDVKRAEAYLISALEIKEDDPKIHTEYGIILLQKGAHIEEAKIHFLRAIELNKRFYKAHFHYSLLLLSENKHKDAKRHLGLALKFCPPQLKDYINDGYRRHLNHQS